MESTRDIERDWEDFWEPIVINRDGQLDEGQIKKELSDMLMFMDNLSKLYDELTNGAVSKPNTDPWIVIDIVRAEMNKQYDAGYEDAKEAMRRQMQYNRH